MIWQILLDAIYQIISTLLSWVSIPPLPAADELQLIIFDFIHNGVGILGFFVNLNLLGTFLGLWMAVKALMITYSMIMWVLNKIGIR